MKRGVSLFAILTLLGASVASVARADSAPWSNWSPFGYDPPKWDGQYFAVSSGFDVTKFGKGRTIAGPTFGVEAGKLWRDGDWVYGFSGSLNAMKPFGVGSYNPTYAEFSRDLYGTGRFKAGYLVTPSVLLYSSVGLTAQHENWRWTGPNGVALSNDRFAVRPDVRVGAEWAVTSNSRIWVEVGVQPPVR